jgi:hypothetical protein
MQWKKVETMKKILPYTEVGSTNKLNLSKIKEVAIDLELKRMTLVMLYF